MPLRVPPNWLNYYGCTGIVVLCWGRKSALFLAHTESEWLLIEWDEMKNNDVVWTNLPPAWALRKVAPFWMAVSLASISPTTGSMRWFEQDGKKNDIEIHNESWVPIAYSIVFHYKPTTVAHTKTSTIVLTMVIKILARRNNTIMGKLKFCVADNPVNILSK